MISEMEENIMDDMNMVLWNELKKHRGHKVNIVSYGDWDNPADICLECEDCGEVVLDANLKSGEYRPLTDTEYHILYDRTDLPLNSKVSI